MAEKKNTILVPVDIRNDSGKIISLALYIASLFDAKITILYVLEGSEQKDFLSLSNEYFEQAKNTAKEKLLDWIKEKVTPFQEKFNVEIHAELREGKVHNQIIKMSQDALMIIMGKSESLNDANTYCIGSHASSVIKQASCPVITLGQDADTDAYKLSKVLLPLDFLHPNKRIIQKAIDFAGYFGATIYVLSVLNDQYKVTRVLKQMQMVQIKKAFNKHGVQCHTQIIEIKDERIDDVIVKHAETVRADLVVLTTQQKKNYVQHFIGSVAQQVILKSEIPVLSVIPNSSFRPAELIAMVEPEVIIGKNTDK